jgi:predicted transcriptional regulator
MDSVIKIVSEEKPADRLNRQLWENSSLSSSSVQEEMTESGLFNDKSPNFAIQREKPEHRLAVILKAEGHSNREIARLLGYTEPWVSQILRQPWARKQVLSEINQGGKEAVQTLLEGSAVDSIYTVIELRDTAEEEGVRLRAAQDLLDRHLGKATQHVEARSTVQHISTEIGVLDDQLAKLEAEERRLLNKPSPDSPVEANS